MINIKKHQNIISMFLGAISALAFAPYFCVYIAVISFSGLTALILKGQSKKELFKIGYSFGFGHFACSFSWVCNALLIESDKFGFLIPITLVASGAFFGLYFAIPAVGTIWAEKKWQKWLLFGVLIALFEWIRGFFLTGFPWNLLGYSLGFSDELMQSASVLGIYGLSLATILSYSVGGLIIDDYSHKKLVIAVTALIMVYAMMWGWGKWRLDNVKLEKSSYIVRIVQPSIKQTMKWDKNAKEDNLRQYLSLSASKSDKVPDLIVWGETALPFVLDYDEEHLRKVTAIIPEKGYLVSGMISWHYKENKMMPHNSMVTINHQGEFVDYYNKSHLVPFGEYIPLREYLPEFIKPVANAIGTFGKGNGPKKIKLKGIPAFGGVICYEIIFPGEVINQKARPDFLINITNDGWYGDSAGIYQHWLITRFRAVEEGIEIVRAANNGISGLINPLGQVVRKMELNEKGFIDVNLHTKLSKNTIYSLWKNKIFLIFCLILSGLCIIRFSSSKLNFK